MFFALSKTLDLFLSPLTWAMLLVLGSAPWRERRSRRRVALGLAGLFVLWAFSIPVVAGSLQSLAERSASESFDSEAREDAVIVLGGALDGGRATDAGRVSWNDNAERLMIGFELLRSGAADKAILTGAEVSGWGSDAHEMRAQLIRWGIAPDRIVVQDRSKNTHEDAAFVRELLESDALGVAQPRLLLVTSAYHMLRAEECFRAVGLEPATLPVDYRAHRRQSLTPLPRAEHLSTSTRMLRELAGRVVYRARGYARPRAIAPAEG